MVSKIREIIADDDFAGWLWAFVPIAGIILLAISLVTVSLIRGGLGQ